jgi:hypothetical protein
MYIECASDDINNAHQKNSRARKKGVLAGYLPALMKLLAALSTKHG